MPFCFSHSSSSSKYSSIEQQKLRENEYKKFLSTLPIIHQYSSERKLAKPRQMNANRNYFLQRRNQVQCRQEKRKHEYERIEKENIRFSQRLINAKSSFNRSEQEVFFDKHCKLKQRLQHYPDTSGNEPKKSDFSIATKKHWRVVDKPTDSSFLIYNDHRTSQKSKQCRETASVHPTSKTSKSQEKVSHSVKQCSGKSLSIISDIEKSTLSSKTSPKCGIPENLKSSSIPSPNTIHWNSSPQTKIIEQSSSSIQPILSSHDLSSSSELSI